MLLFGTILKNNQTFRFVKTKHQADLFVEPRIEFDVKNAECPAIMPLELMNDKLVRIHGNNWNYKDVADQIEWARMQNWHLKKWTPRAALISKGKISDYVGQKYNSDHTILKKQGWKHDHCEICFWTIFESKNPEYGTAYTTDGHRWICQECYEQFIS